MQKLLVTIGLITITSATFTQEKTVLNATLIARIEARYKNAPIDYESLTVITRKLFDENKFGPELADFLDLKLGLQNYTYKGHGIYEHKEGNRIHHFSRHLCEGVTEEEAYAAARKLHEKEALTQNDGFGSSSHKL